MSITVGSASLDHGNYFKVNVDGQPVEIQGERGIGLVVVEKGSRKVIFSRLFDTSIDPSESAKLNTTLLEVKVGNIIIMGVKNEASKALSLDLIQTISLLGSKQIQSLAYRDSWALLVRKGKPQSAKEVKEAHSAVELTWTKKPLLHKINISSASFDHGNAFSLAINDNPNNTISYVNGSQRGIVLIILDKEGKVRMNQIFDTSESTAASDQLESSIQSLTSQYPGNLIILGVKDEGSRSLTPSLRRVISSLGSLYINQLGYRESWCFIARLGKPQSAKEMKDSKQSVTLSWVPKKQRIFNPSFTVHYNPPSISDPHHPHSHHLVDEPIHTVHHRNTLGPGVSVGTSIQHNPNRARRRETLG